MIRIDRPNAWPEMPCNPNPAGQWAHLWPDIPDAEGVVELHAFAVAIGLKHEWFQDKPGFPHYDVTGSKIAAACAVGAVVSSLREWVRVQRVWAEKEQPCPTRIST